MMKQQLKAALAAALCLCLLAGCAGSAAPASSTPPAGSASTAQTQPAGSAPSVSTAPSSALPVTADGVYRQGDIGPVSEDSFDVPPGLDQADFSLFSYFLTIAIQSPLNSLDEMDEATAFRFARCMIEFFYMANPALCDQTIELTPNSGVRYSIIPLTEFLGFTAEHFGIEDISFFQNAIPATDTIVLFRPEMDQILLIPAMEWLASDFKTAYLSVEGSAMRLCAHSDELGDLQYNFDISGGLGSYFLVDVVEAAS